jgi:hypothetical protein
MATAGTDESARSFATITAAANELISAVHDRMPVIRPKDHDRGASTSNPTLATAGAVSRREGDNVADIHDLKHVTIRKLMSALIMRAGN